MMLYTVILQFHPHIDMAFVVKEKLNYCLETENEAIIVVLNFNVDILLLSLLPSTLIDYNLWLRNIKTSTSI